MCPRRILHRAYFRWTILQPSDPAEAVSIYQYTCLFCNDIMTSTVKTGRVEHRRSGGCGRQFYVRHGVCMRTHAPPGTIVQSSLKNGPGAWMAASTA